MNNAELKPYSQQAKLLWQRPALAQEIDALHEATKEVYWFLGRTDTAATREQLAKLLVAVKSKVSRAEHMLGKLPTLTE